MPAAIIWEDRAYSSGTYLCRIERSDDRNARLTMHLEGTVNYLIHEEAITLELNSVGQPVHDVAKWRAICDDVIDKPQLRSSIVAISSSSRR